ncbi:MAG: TerB family tellurite resistance protein [Candidatus Promineifilaceae bacterium]|jgi:uncharacterized tellurite resistance protein B-like protein
MSDKEFVMTLAKVIIAAAWADDQVTNEEINSVKDLIFHLRRSGFDDVNPLSAQEWSRLEMYIETPVSREERTRLVVELQNSLRSKQQKEMVIETMKHVMEADGTVSEDEKEVILEIEKAIDSVETGFFGDLERLVGGAVNRRTKAVANAPNREQYFDDFIQNKVFYNLRLRLQIDSSDLKLPEDELRTMSLVGGLMAKIAYVDKDVTEEEYNRITKAIAEIWETSPQMAAFVAEVAVSAIDDTYDTFRMMRELMESTSDRERRKFLDLLFAVANADGNISYDETEEIRKIARGINLTHKDFIDSKLRIVGE